MQLISCFGFNSNQKQTMQVIACISLFHTAIHKWTPQNCWWSQCWVFCSDLWTKNGKWQQQQKKPSIIWIVINLSHYVLIENKGKSENNLIGHFLFVCLCVSHAFIRFNTVLDTVINDTRSIGIESTQRCLPFRALLSFLRNIFEEFRHRKPTMTLKRSRGYPRFPFKSIIRIKAERTKKFRLEYH